MVAQIECPVCRNNTSITYYMRVSTKRELLKNGLSKIEFICHGCDSIVTMTGPVCIRCGGSGKLYEKTISGNSIISKKCPECIGLEIIPNETNVVDSGKRPKSNNLQFHGRHNYYNDGYDEHRMVSYEDYYS